jgi:hypothetical protein
MKKAILLLALSLFSVQSFANCKSAYLKASHNRDIRNEVIAITAVIGTAAGAVVASTGIVAGLFAAGYSVSLFHFVPTTDRKRRGYREYANNFDKITLSVEAAKEGVENRHLNKIVNKAIKKAGLEKTDQLVLQAKEVLVDNFENETYCPLVRVKKNGKEKRAVFTRKAIIKNLSESII